MTTPTATSTISQAPLAPCAGQAAGESTADYGRRALFHALQAAPWYAPLDDAGVEAAYDACTEAVTARDITPVTLSHLNSLQVSLRRQLVARQVERQARDQRLQAAFDLAGRGQASQAPIGAQAGSQAGQDGSQGGGGSKVKAPRPPKGQPPAGGLVQAVDESGAGAFRAPAAVYRVPAAQLSDADAF